MGRRLVSPLRGSVLFSDLTGPHAQLPRCSRQDRVGGLLAAGMGVSAHPPPEERALPFVCQFTTIATVWELSIVTGMAARAHPISSEELTIQSVLTISNSELWVLRSRSWGRCSGRTVEAATQSEMQVDAVGKLSIP